MVKGVSTQIVVKSFSAILKMDGDMAIFFVSMLTEQGLDYGTVGKELLHQLDRWCC
ncbi:unnamed protein product [Camellia sinensis]